MFDSAYIDFNPAGRSAPRCCGCNGLGERWYICKTIDGVHISMAVCLACLETARLNAEPDPMPEGPPVPFGSRIGS